MIKVDNSDEDDFNLDSVLNLEEKYYEDGFKEGQLAGKKNLLKEGKELGIQTGFQRFLLLGQFNSLVNKWLLTVEEHINTDGHETSKDIKGKERNWVKLKSQIESVRRLIHSIIENDTVTLSNSSADVVLFENVLKQSRAKIRTLSSTMGDYNLYLQAEKLSEEVGKTIPTAPLTGAEEDMW
ncbi:hypothetical protein B5S31_g338 [[Candida] boidinii]|nr:hypothetical protein B5S29_g773 [[Candida] boidinii]OWB70659.1 hypothetical protein B5S31_g338 [[Candida] boidinii]